MEFETTSEVHERPLWPVYNMTGELRCQIWTNEPHEPAIPCGQPASYRIGRTGPGICREHATYGKPIVEIGYGIAARP